VVKIFNGLISGAVAGINALISAYNAIPFLPNVSKISMPTVSVPSIKTPTRSQLQVLPSIPSISTFGGGATSSGGGGVSTGVAKAAQNCSKDHWSRLLQAFQRQHNIPGWNCRTLRGTIINVTVNGAVDKEGTARTIVDTLNNSYYRGTGGACRESSRMTQWSPDLAS
jgi:hypothetical protein